MVLEFVPRTSVYSEIHHATSIMLFHKTMKGIQFGLVGGCFIGLSLSTLQFISQLMNHKYHWNKVIKTMMKGMFYGAIIANGLAIYKIYINETKSNQSQAFSILRDTTHNIIDNFMLLGMVLGAIIVRIRGTEKLKKNKFAGVIIGGISGILFGMIFNIFYKS